MNNFVFLYIFYMSVTATRFNGLKILRLLIIDIFNADKINLHI